jgi:hypothetical protein
MTLRKTSSLIVMAAVAGSLAFSLDKKAGADFGSGLFNSS